MGGYHSLLELKISWLKLRKKYQTIKKLMPLIPLKNIEKNKDSSLYPLRLSMKSEGIDSLCKVLLKEKNVCFSEYVLLKN